MTRIGAPGSGLTRREFIAASGTAGLLATAGCAGAPAATDGAAATGGAAARTEMSTSRAGR